MDDLLPAEKAGLITLDGQRITFRHPLIREAVYQRAPMSLRLAVHAALAETLTGDHRADRRAWHLAAAATGPDEHVAAQLERTGARAARRRGHAVAAGAYERAAALTEAGPGARARRLTLGAEAATEAGDLDWAAKLAAEAESQAVSQTEGQAGADPLLRSRIAHGRIEAALTRLEALTNGPGWYHVSAMRCVPDLVEAAVRRGGPGRAEHAVARYSRLGQRHLTERCRALLAEDAAAEPHYLAALAVQAPPFERARTSLLYGEWLRRARRRSAAIPQLRDARDTFERLGARPWADRAGNELRAAGARSADTPSTDVPGPSGQAGLTPQERQIVRLAARGLSNKDIAAQLFLSPRTVGYHLYKAYPKLGVASRAELVALD